MRRLTTMMASAAAAALTALAVTIAVPAIADDGPDAGAEGDGFAACLRADGLDGAPDGAALKPWLGERLDRGDATAERALTECSEKHHIVKAGPSEQELRSCLEDQGVDVPGDDGAALKRWVLEHGDDATHRDAMKACDMPLVIKRRGGEACEDPEGVTTALPARRVDEVSDDR